MLACAAPASMTEATHNLDQAIDFLRRAGTVGHLPRGPDLFELNYLRLPGTGLSHHFPFPPNPQGRRRPPRPDPTGNAALPVKLNTVARKVFGPPMNADKRR
jgi:hypothetical protein